MTIQANPNDTKLPSEMTHFFSHVFKRFIWIYSLVATLLVGLLLYVYQEYNQNLETSLLNQEETFVTSTTQAIQKEMQIQLMVMQMNTRFKFLTDFLEDDTQTTRQALQTHFSNLALTFHRYDQIRFIDLKGQERIRVNYKNNATYIVKEEDLQDKSRSKYFREGIKLPAGKVYVSPMELNVEYNQIQIPYKPVVRFATPVVDDKGNKIGLIVLNYLATELLHNFREHMESRIRGQGMLIGPKGYWMSNHDRANEWGNSLDQVDQKFEHQYPEAWQAIQQNKEGILKTSKGIFRYKSIDPFSLDSIGSYEVEQTIKLTISEQSKENNNWKLVVFLPNETIREESFFCSREGKAIIVFLFISVAVIIFLLLIISEEKRRKINYDLFIKDELNDLYENSPCGYHSLDRQGRVLKMNQTELKWLGYAKKDVIGKSFTDFLTPQSIQVFQEFLKNLPLNKKIEGVVLEIQCKNGGTFFVSTSATSILEQGNFVMARTSAFNITDRIELENRLAYIANTDVLTEISNRRHFFTLATQKFETEEQLSLLMLDIDHFKHVNDKFGHDAGDEVLKNIASNLQQTLPNEAILARLGGEEFAVLLSGLDAEQTLKLAEEVCENIALTPININSDTTINITISIGTSQKETEDDDIGDLLKRADITLYEAKTTGRNKAV